MKINEASGRKTAAVVLAAGLSRRMGQPKMLLPWGETKILGQVLTVLAEALEAKEPKSGDFGVRENVEDFGTLGEIIVVTGGVREAVEGLIGQLGLAARVRCVFNPAYEAGEMLSSLQVGLAALGPEVEFALIGLGDQPQVSLGSARRVVRALDQAEARLIVPSFNKRRGHPWLVARSLWPEILAMRPPQTLRDFLNAHAGEILYVESDETVLKDLDTPEEYLREKP